MTRKGPACTPRRKCRSRPGSMARALDLRSRKFWLLIVARHSNLLLLEPSKTMETHTNRMDRAGLSHFLCCVHFIHTCNSWRLAWSPAHLPPRVWSRGHLAPRPSSPATAVTVQVPFSVPWCFCTCCVRKRHMEIYHKQQRNCSRFGKSDLGAFSFGLAVPSSHNVYVLSRHPGSGSTKARPPKKPLIEFQKHPPRLQSNRSGITSLWNSSGTPPAGSLTSVYAHRRRRNASFNLRHSRDFNSTTSRRGTLTFCVYMYICMHLFFSSFSRNNAHLVHPVP